MDTDNQNLLESLTPEIVQNFRRAIEIGKWPNGVALTKEQKATCMQAVIAYEAKHLPPEQRTGYVPPKQPCADEHSHAPSETPLKWQ
ncbi:YeaC family protein [Halioxenophilus aromaticivorans]